MARAIYYDTETTGISTQNDFIVEIAAYDNERDVTFESLVKPPIPIPEGAAAVHGISDEMVANAKDFSEVGKEFLEFCDGDVILIAHNNDNFDKPLLLNELQRHGLKAPNWKWLDTLKWARRYRRDLPRHTLQFLREIYGIEENNAHRALDDVIVLHKMFTIMIDDLTIDQAYELLNTFRAVETMPFGKHQGKPLKALPKDYIEWLIESGTLEKPNNQELKTSLESLKLLLTVN